MCCAPDSDTISAIIYVEVVFNSNNIKSVIVPISLFNNLSIN